MNYFEENDYDSSEDNEYNEFTADIIAEFNYDKKIEIVSFYKEKLSKEPEFIGIKNICSGKILSFIEDTNKVEKPKKLTIKDYKLNFEQYSIFIDMYSELNLTGNYYIFNLVTKKIFSKIYV